MSLSVGIVGLPNVGKSTLFNALLKKRVALSANYPFATIEPNTGVVEVPDARLGKLAELVEAEESSPSTSIRVSRPPVVPAIVQFVDIAGLVKGASTGAGLGNQFLSHIREVDAIIHVLRDFADSNIIREGSVSADEDKNIIETELALADLQTMEKLVAAQEKQTKASKDPLETQKLEILKLVQADLSAGKMGSFDFAQDLRDERLISWFKTLPLLTTKPVLYVFNTSEEEYGARVKEEVDNAIIISAKLEEDLADLNEQERKEYLSQMGIEETALERLIKKAYQLLGLASFLTAGVKEVRAWTFAQGAKAPEAAGAIHTDFTKKFIRAQVIEFQKLIEAGSYKLARDKGWIRTEGKEYVVKDGDVIEFLINAN